MVRSKGIIFIELVLSALMSLNVATESQQNIEIFDNLELVNEVNSEVEKRVTSEERELLAKLLYCEARGESLECQKAIVSVVLNRLDSGKWGNDLSSVIYAKNQFVPAMNGSLNKATPTETQYEAIDYVLENGETVPSWVQFFRASYHFSWKGYTGYIKIDNTYFGGYNG